MIAKIWTSQASFEPVYGLRTEARSVTLASYRIGAGYSDVYSC